jgi:iron complex transport system substrate-binding protein
VSRFLAAALAAGAALAAASAAAAAPRVLSLDQCADQYVLALAPRAAIAGLSPRADDADSALRARALGLPLRRPTLEAALAAQPEVVVRYWGGDPGLLRELERRGVRVVKIEDATDFAGVRANVRTVARALGAEAGGEAIVRDMDRKLAAARGAWGERRALYLTPSGFTAGPGTLVDSILRAAGLTNAAARPGFSAAPLERLVLDPPALMVRGFFDAVQGDRWGAGRNPVLREFGRGRVVADLPGAWLGCPAWFAADASAAIAARAPRRP